MSESSDKQTKIRTPKQNRSIETKNKISKSALILFCSKGFYKTTTNEIAKEAGVPIGSLYSYFKNKDAILLDILDDFNNQFVTDIDTFIKNSIEPIDYTFTEYFRLVLTNTIKSLVQSHVNSKEFILELESLANTKPEVKNIINHHSYELQKMTHKLIENSDNVKVSNLDAASIIVYNIITSTVDQIVFQNTSVSDDCIIENAVTAIFNYLFK